MTGTELFGLLREAKTSFEFDPKSNSFYGLEGDIKIELSDLADLINDYFLPRPLFEDGTPVKVGDEFALHKPSDSEKIIDYCVCDDGSFAINNFQYDQDQRVMKPKQPEALDADGVPIKINDKLYLTDGFIIKLKCVGFSNDGLVKVTNWGSSEGWVPILVEANDLTHRKPDSWEQLEEDAKKSGAAYWGCDGDHCFECEHGLMQTKKTCTVNKHIDLIRRAKALAGVKDE